MRDRGGLIRLQGKRQSVSRFTPDGFGITSSALNVERNAVHWRVCGAADFFCLARSADVPVVGQSGAEFAVPTSVGDREFVLTIKVLWPQPIAKYMRGAKQNTNCLRHFTMLVLW
jgi:hypothetical protein